MILYKGGPNFIIRSERQSSFFDKHAAATTPKTAAEGGIIVREDGLGIDAKRELLKNGIFNFHTISLSTYSAKSRRAYYVSPYAPSTLPTVRKSTIFDEKLSAISTIPRRAGSSAAAVTRSYTDQLFYSPGSKRHPGWTTVTETTTIMYAKRHSFGRTVNGRKQHIMEVNSWVKFFFVNMVN
jgi:hypothetical protein